MPPPFISLPPSAAFRPSLLVNGPPTDLRLPAPSTVLFEGMAAKTITGPFHWASASVAADNGVSIIKPNDIAPIDPGRWIADPLPGSSPQPYEFLLSGVYSGAVVPGVFDPPEAVLSARTCSRATLIRRTAGFAGLTSIRLTRNGADVLVAPLAINALSGDNVIVQTAAFVPAEVTFAPGDIIECLLNTVETFLPGPPPGPEGLRFILEF